MALPADLSTFTLRGKYKDFEGNPLYGADESVTVTYPVIVNDPAETTTLVPREITRPLDATGSFSMVIPVSDDPDLEPTGFIITLKENFAGGRTLKFLAPDGVSTIWVSSMETGEPDDVQTVVYATFAALEAAKEEWTVEGDAFDSRLDVLEAAIADDSTQYVGTSGNQTIGGTKTFSIIPVLPASNPASANQAARKQYVDEGDAAVAATVTALDGAVVKLSGAQTVAGVKTFSSLPEVSASPTTGNQLARKTYVDAGDSTVAGTVTALDAAVVKLTGAQTVAGVKTFSSIPVLPASDPVAANEAVRKAYFDAWASLIDGAAVHKTGDETIAGIKTFSSIPVGPAGTDPTTNDQLARKSYVDRAYKVPVPFSRSGALTVAAGVNRFYLDRAYTLTSVRVGVGTAPTGATLIVDVNKNGTTVYGTQANRPTVAIGANAATGGAASVNSFAAGDYITVDVDQIGSTVAGSDLTVVVYLQAA